MIKNVYEYVKDNEFRFTVFNDRIHVINYKRIISLQDDDISFLGDDKKIVVKGKDLTLNKMLDDEVLILGSVTKIEVFNV